MIDKIKNAGQVHPIIVSFVYYVAICAFVSPLKDNLEKLFANWALNGLIGGLISFNTIGYIIVIVLFGGLFVGTLFIYANAEVHVSLYHRYPKSTKVLGKIFMAITNLYIVLTIIMFFVNIYRVFISGTIDGYRADMAMIFYNIIPYLYGVLAFGSVGWIFIGYSSDM